MTAPDRAAGAAFLPCFRHPDRATGISCQRCRRPICGQCMHEASVGFQCPDCIGRQGGRAARTRFGAPLGAAARGGLGGLSAAAILVGVRLIVGVLDLPLGGALQSWLYMWNGGVAQGQVWRLLTSAFTSAGLFSLLINSLFLFVIARSLEGELGRLRLILVYLACGVGSSLFFFFLGPAAGVMGGGTGAVLGLIGLSAAAKAVRRQDCRGELVMIGLLVALGLFGGGGYWAALLGGAITGGLLGLALGRPRRRT